MPAARHAKCGLQNFRHIECKQTWKFELYINLVRKINTII